MSADIKDILIISTQDQLTNFINLLGDGNKWGLNITYAAQDQPRGVADAFLIAENVGFLGQDNPCAMALGDNIFYGESFYKDLTYISKMNTNCVFGYRVSNPYEYGVVEFETPGRFNHDDVIVKGIEEKPANPKTDYAVPGLYFFDNTAVSRARQLKPSAERGELEITDLNNSYIRDKKLLKDNAAWFDTGNADAMFEAAMFVKSIQSRTGQMIGCVDEIAYKKGFINEDQFWDLLNSMPSCQYKHYLQDKHKVNAYV